MLTIGIAADHPAVRDGLRTLLETTLACAVIGNAASAQEGLALTERLRPDVLVIDQGLRTDTGLHLISQVHRSQPRTHIVVLGMGAHAADVRAALRAGALAYVRKETAAAELQRAIMRAAQGQRYVSPPLTAAATANDRGRY